MKSMTTTTVMSREVPPNEKGMLNASANAIGSSAMTVRNSAPGSVIRDSTVSMYSAVFAPGFTPGTNPPCFFRFSATSTGLKMIDV